MDLSGGARVNDEVWYIERYMRKEAKYMQKRPNESNKTRFCLSKHDLDLWVTICHIRRSQFGTGAHILLSIGDDRLRVNSAIAIETRS
jgi:hypothetical protein